MILQLVLLLLGLVILVFAADLLVRGVSTLARAAGVPPLVIGLTIVAFGTSTPEIVINTISASRGETSLAFGNVVGSTIVNIGFVLALTALVRPLRVERSVVTREMPILLLAVAAMVVLSADRYLAGDPTDRLTRGDGLMLLLLFAVFLYSIVLQVMAKRVADPFVAEVADAPATEAIDRRGLGLAVVLTLVGLVGVGAGGRLTVAAAVKIAAALGVPEVIVGLTIVSLGTTLPELVTGIMAARRGDSDIAVGNIVGSNIFNILFIGGLVATIAPVPIPAGGLIDLAAAAGLSLLDLPIALRRGFVITRAEGAVLLLLYAAYAGWRLWGGLSA